MLCGSIETPEAHVSSFDQLEPVAFSGSRTGRSLGQSGVFSIFFPLPPSGNIHPFHFWIKRSLTAAVDRSKKRGLCLVEISAADEASQDDAAVRTQDTVAHRDED